MSAACKSVLVLFSGGVDSTALVHFYLNNGYIVNGLHIQYGQKNKDSELKAVKEISDHYNIDVTIINLELNFNKNNNEYIFRNSLFINLAAATLQENFFRISLGIHSGVPYYDSSEMFLSDIQRVADGYFSGTVLIEAPFLHFGKQEIFKYCIENNVPIEKTYSCESREFLPCGKCLSCMDRRKLLDGII